MSDEAHLPAEQARAGAAARFPVPHGDGGRPQGPERAPRARPQEAVGLSEPLPAPGRVTRRADYLAANRGLRAPTAGFVLLVRDRADGDASMRVGITVSGKVGGAVIRNRMKRRFRELARAMLPGAGIAGADHILIGRNSGVERDWDLLQADLHKALRKLKARS
jgi:ribonuclease P protein component